MWTRFCEALDSKMRVRGLGNYFLSCCVNSLLQTLSATWELIDLLDRWEPADGGSERHGVALELKRVLKLMRSGSTKSDPHLDFLRCLNNNGVRLGMEHDADEVFLFILNFTQEQMDNQTLALEIQNLYKISVEMSVKCSACGFTQNLSSFMLNLPLHIQEDRNRLEDCISSFFKPQELEGRDCCYCPQCRTKKPSQKATALLSLPRVLRVNLKRFRSHRGWTRKLDCEVTFPESLDLSKVLPEGALSADATRTDLKYKLFAVVVHSGTALFGHYTAYLRHQGDQSWYFADDSNVEEVSWEKVRKTYGGNSRQTAYMLMYRRGGDEDGETAPGRSA